MKPVTRARRGLCRAALLTTLLTGAVWATLPGSNARAEQPAVKAAAPTSSQSTATTPSNVAPTSVVLFPAVIGSDAADSAAASAANLPPDQREALDIVTESLRTYLQRGGIGVVVYNKRLPSVERAVAEGLKPEDAAAGPGDDPRKAQKFASILNAAEYLTATVDNYKFDTATRTVTFNLSINRYNSDGDGLGATAQKAIGNSSADTPGSKQETFAVEEAARVVSEQAVESVYPQTVAVINPVKTTEKKHHKKFGYFLIPIIAVGAALIAPHT